MLTASQMRAVWAMEAALDRAGLKSFKETPPPPLRLTYSVVNHGDDTAGIPYFSDTVTVEVESGDPGGEEGEFAEFMLTALKEWYDGARVTKEG